MLITVLGRNKNSKIIILKKINWGHRTRNPISLYLISARSWISIQTQKKVHTLNLLTWKRRLKSTRNNPLFFSSLLTVSLPLLSAALFKRRHMHRMNWAPFRLSMHIHHFTVSSYNLLSMENWRPLRVCKTVQCMFVFFVALLINRLLRFHVLHRSFGLWILRELLNLTSF